MRAPHDTEALLLTSPLEIQNAAADRRERRLANIGPEAFRVQNVLAARFPDEIEALLHWSSANIARTRRRWQAVHVLFRGDTRKQRLGVEIGFVQLNLRDFVKYPGPYGVLQLV